MDVFCKEAAILQRMTTAWFRSKPDFEQCNRSWKMRWICIVACTVILNPISLVLADRFLIREAHAGNADISNYPIKQYTIEQGLSQSVVYDVVQDHLGYIWIATGRGLNRFDGHQFKVFLKDYESRQALQSDYIHNLLVDHRGELWVGTLGGGLAKYQPESEDFVSIVLDANTSNLEIYELIEDELNNVWVVTEKTLYRISADRTLIESYRAQIDDLKGAPKTLASGIENQLFIGTDLGEVAVFAPCSKEADLACGLRKIVDDVTLGSIKHISQLENGKLLFASSTQGLFELNAGLNSPNQNKDLSPIKLADINAISAATLDKQGHLWISSDGNGLYQFNLQTRTLTTLRRKRSENNSLASDRLLSVFRDASDTLWVGTFASGLNAIGLTPSKFQRITDDVDQKVHLSNRIIWAVHADQQGGLWVGTDTGVDYRAPNTERFELVGGLTTQNGELTLNDATSFVEEGDVLWIGTWAQGLVKYNRRTQVAEQIRSTSQASRRLSSDRVRVLLNTPDGTLWIGTRQGLNVLDKKTGQVVTYQTDFDDPHSLPHNRIRGLYLENTGRIWVGTSAGLVYFDPEIDGFKRPSLDEPWRSELQKMDVRAIHKDADGVFWIGTGDGLLKADFNNKKVKPFLQKEGLPNNVLYSLLADSFGNYWIATDHGLSQFNPDKETFSNYFASDGLQGSELNFGAHTRDLNGNLYFGGTEGLTIFRESEMHGQDFASVPLVVNEITSYDSSYNQRKHYVCCFKSRQQDKQFFVFDIDDKRLEISFAGLDYKNPQRLKYAYQLGNQDQDWIRVDASNRLAVYTNLEPGLHEFKVGFASDTSDEISHVVSIPIYMKPAFWQTNWFKFVIALGLIALIILIVNFRVRILRARAQLHKVEIEAKTRALKNSYEARSKDLAIVSHNLGTPIAVINQMTGTMKKRLQELGVFDSDISDQLELLREGINEADQRVKQLSDVVNLHRWELKKNEIIEVKPKLSATLPAFAESSARIDVGDMPQARVFCPSDAPSIILDNLISNALKYSPEESQISLRFIKTRTHYCIQCSDLGSGIPKADRERVKNFEFRRHQHALQAPGQGIGLSLVNAMLEACGGVFEITDNVPCGSVMSAFIPLVD